MQEHNLTTLSGNANNRSEVKPTYDFGGIAPDEVAAEFARPKSNIDHSRILEALKDQFEPLDFEALAFPQAEPIRKELTALQADKESRGEGSHPKQARRKELEKALEGFKLTQKHYLIYTVENVLEVAQNNRWGLCKNHDFIYLYNGAFWSEVDKEAFQKFLGEAAEKMGVSKHSARFYQFREQLFKQFLSAAYLPTPAPDSDRVLINLQNGTFEVGAAGKQQLRPFNANDFLTYQLPFAYDAAAKAPLFEAYLNRVLPDRARQNVLAEYLGFVFIKHGSRALKEEKALILYGTGANGKSVFAELVNALLGAANVCNYSLQSLTDNTGYYRAKTANKLVNYASEINGKLETSIFKQLVSGEPVEARLPYGQPFTLTQYAKLIFNCNELPKDVEHTNAYFRRFLIIPFDVTIPEAEQDKTLHTKIIENELAGVFNWVLSGLARLLQQGRFSACEAAQKAIEQYRLESDSVQVFINEEGYQISVSAEMKLQTLFQDYRTYCAQNGFRPCSQKTFGERARNAGFAIERKNYGRVINAVKNDFL